MYENGKRQLRYEPLYAIADFYHVSLDYLFGRVDTPELPPPLSREENAVLQWYHGLDEPGRAEILGLAKTCQRKHQQDID